MAEQPNPNKISFGWGNYLKPSPTNVQYFALAIKGIVAGVGGTTLLMEADKWITFWIILAGLLLDEVAKFAGRAAHGGQQGVQVSFPEELSDQVTVTQGEIKKDDPGS